MRWTQLTPMIMVWGFALLMLLALTVVNFQQQTISAIEFVLEWLVQLPLVGERLAALLADEGANGHMTTADFKSFMLSAWAIASLLFMLAGMAVSSVFGPFEPWTMKRKLLLVLIGIALILAGMLANYFAVPQNFNGAASGWVINFSMISLLLFLVSAYCLSIAHFLGFLNDALMAGELKSPADSGAMH
jgi:hypothetical protein